MKKAALISLGCAKNLVDSEAMVGRLLAMGYRMSEEISEATLILVNTCGFLESAVKEAIAEILRAAGQKESGRCETLVVSGCMVQRYGKKLLKELPEVDIFLGTSHYHALEEALNSRFSGNPRRLWIGQPEHLFSFSGDEPERVPSTGPGWAYLKIAEGCGNSCSFCIIPHLRGPLRSRSVEDVAAEAALLASRNVREINLIAQDTTAFGLDRGEEDGLPRLLERLEEIEGLRWIRILYSYPDRVSTRLLKTMARSEKIVPYLDIPIQHCAPGVLKAMGRPAADPLETIEKIRSHIPGIVLRTSVMTGFPGETRKDFKALLSFIERVRFDHAGVFAYSPETGTAAARLPANPSRRTAENRRAALLELQREISREKLSALTGELLPVLIEGEHPESELLVSGRYWGQAPEVDGSVIVTSGECVPGEIRNVRITASHAYDLEGVMEDS